MKLTRDDLRLLGDLPRPCAIELPDRATLDGAIAKACGERLKIWGSSASLDPGLMMNTIERDIVVRSDLFYGREAFEAKLLAAKFTRDAAVLRFELELGVLDEPKRDLPDVRRSRLDAIGVVASVHGLIGYVVRRRNVPGSVLMRDVLAPLAGLPLVKGFATPVFFDDPFELEIVLETANVSSTVTFRADFTRDDGLRFFLIDKFRVDAGGAVHRAQRIYEE